MKLAYLVFAYKNPRLLRKTIEHLSSENSSFFVHIDRKSNLEDFSAVRGENVFFSETRLPVYWAEFSGIRAIELLIRQALSHSERPDYLVLLSGSEFPLRSREYIESFFESNRGAEFMTLVRMPNAEAGKPISRINTLRIQSDRPLYRQVVRGLAKVGLAQRDYKKHLGELEPYSGHTWWALSREACEYILEFEKKHPRVAEFFEDTFAPEESYFQTILGNSPFAARARRNLVFEDWAGQKAHPAMINENHVAFFNSRENVSVEDVHGPGELLFARKFSDETLPLIAKVQEMIERKEKLLEMAAPLPQPA